MNNIDKKIKAYIYDMLSKREYSEKELKQKIYNKFSKYIEKESYNELNEVIDKQITFFKEKNYLSNERFAESKVRSLINKKTGPKKIKQELKMKGIEDSLIEKFMEENTQTINEQIAELKEKYSEITDQKEKQKIYRRLLYKGYTYDQISEIFK